MARIEAAVRGQPIAMPRDDAEADWTYAGDAAQAAWLALTADELPHHLYNVGTERRCVRDFTKVLRELLPEATITTAGDEAPGNAHAPMDASRLKNDLGFAPRFTLRSGAEDYIRRIRIYDAFQQTDR